MLPLIALVKIWPNHRFQQSNNLDPYTVRIRGAGSTQKLTIGLERPRNMAQEAKCSKQKRSGAPLVQRWARTHLGTAQYRITGNAVFRTGTKYLDKKNNYGVVWIIKSHNSSSVVKLEQRKDEHWLSLIKHGAMRQIYRICILIHEEEDGEYTAV